MSFLAAVASSDQGGITGFEWVWMALAVAADVFSYAGGAVGGRGRVGSYY